MSRLCRPSVFCCAACARIGASSAGPCIGAGRLPTGGRRLRSPRSPVRRSPDGIRPSGRQYRQRSPWPWTLNVRGRGAFCITAGGRNRPCRTFRPGPDIDRHRADAGELAVSPAAAQESAAGTRPLSQPAGCGADPARLPPEPPRLVGSRRLLPRTQQSTAGDRYRARVRAHWQRLTRRG